MNFVLFNIIFLLVFLPPFIVIHSQTKALLISLILILVTLTALFFFYSSFFIFLHSSLFLSPVTFQHSSLISPRSHTHCLVFFSIHLSLFSLIHIHLYITLSSNITHSSPLSTFPYIHSLPCCLHLTSFSLIRLLQ